MNESHCVVFDNRVLNVATLTNRVLEVALGGLEAGADLGRLLVGRARRKLGGKLGFERPLGFDDEVGTRGAPAGLVGRRDGDLGLGQVANLDLRGDLALDKREDRFVKRARDLDQALAVSTSKSNVELSTM